MGLIEEFKRAGRTIVLTTHYMDEAERLCDRVAIMDHGKVIARGTPARARSRRSASSTGGVLDGAMARRRSIWTALGGIDGVRDARVDERRASRMQAIELHRVVPALLEELRRQGVPLTELRTHSATLEDVFVSLTGRHLRDE